MKALMAILPFLLLARAFAADAPSHSSAHPSKGNVHRFLIERSFQPGALDGLDAATRQKVNANNASVGVRWLYSYANADRTKTFCLYEGPSEAAVRSAATLNGLPVDGVTEVPVDLDPGSQAHPGAGAAAHTAAAAAGGNHRYLIERTFPAGALEGLDAAAKAKVNANNAQYGVNWVTSYATADKTRTFCIYEGPSEAAVREAATANQIPVDSVTEVPVTLGPK
jgi:hypothetical protein